MLSNRLLSLAASLLAVGSLGYAQANLPPVVFTGGNSGLDYRVDCNNDFASGSAITHVQLDGSASYDPNGTPVTFDWHNECGFGSFDDPTSPTPVYHVDMTGSCTRDCWIALRVTSGGQTTIKGFQVIVQDATPPVIQIPNDVIGIWGDSIDSAATGAALASDNCDPTPVVSFTDVAVPGTGPGQPELTLRRTWTVTDCSGFQASAMQTILLLAPTGLPGSQANLDFDPSQCPNQFSLLPGGNVDVLLLGSPSFKTAQVIKNTVRLSLRDNPAVSVAPTSFMAKDLGSITATAYGDCNSSALDGQKDLRLRFGRALLANALGLPNLASGQQVEVVLTGRLTTGKLWAVRDTITIQ